MRLQQQFDAEGVEWRRVEHGDTTELVADFGPQANCSAEVVGDTVIVVADGEQYEFDVGAGARAFMTNGVLSIEVNE